MQGLASLPQAQQGPMQGPMPGQAPMQPMQGMMPQQGAPTPASMVAPLKQLRSEQLRQMYTQKPTWAILTAYNEAREREAREAALQGQAAQQAAAANQGRTVADDLLAQPVMAAHGGEMHSYAGGGAVAFTNGGDVEVKRILQKSPYERTPEENEILRAAGVQVAPRVLPQEGGISALNRMLESPFLRRMFTGDAYRLSPEELSKRTDTGATTERMFRALGGNQFVEPTAAPAAEQITDTGDEATRMLGRAPAPMPTRDTRGATPLPGPSMPPGGQRQPAERPRTGIATLMGPQIDPYELEGRNAASAASEYQAALQKATQLTPEQIAARQRIDEAMSGRKRFLGTEEQRRESLAEKRLQEALERSRVKPLEDITFIGQMLEGMRGTKRFGEGLAGLASGAGRAQAGRQAALRAAEEKYDLSRNDIFRLQDARNQLDMDEAKLAEARATGSADKINAAAANVAKSKMDLAKVQADLRDRSVQRSLEREKIDVERGKIAAAAEGTRAAREGTTQQRLMGMIAGAEARKQELIRKITEDHRDANKQVYLMTSIPGAKVTPEMMAQKQDLDRQLALKIRSATADLDRMIAQTASQIPGFGSLYGTSGGGLPAGVTVEKVGN